MKGGFLIRGNIKALFHELGLWLIITQGLGPRAIGLIITLGPNPIDLHVYLYENKITPNGIEFMLLNGMLF